MERLKKFDDGDGVLFAAYNKASMRNNDFLLDFNIVFFECDMLLFLVL
jgi:hypothetical protein